MTPTAFRAMTLAEARDYIQGQDRRHRAGWEQARLIVSPYIKEGESIEFPWEAKRITPDDREAWERLKAKAAKINQQQHKQ